MGDLVELLDGAKAVRDGASVSEAERGRRAADAELRADPERMAICRLLGVPPREVVSWVEMDAGLVITLVGVNAPRMIVVPEARPDGAGRSGLMLLDAPGLVQTKHGPMAPRLAPGQFVFTPRPGDARGLRVPEHREVIEGDEVAERFPGRVGLAPPKLARQIVATAGAWNPDDVLRFLLARTWARTVLDESIDDEERRARIDALIGRYRFFLHDIPIHQAPHELRSAEKWFADRGIDPDVYLAVMPSASRGLFGRGSDAA